MVISEPESTGPTKSKTSNEEDVAPDDAAAGSSDTKAVESEDQGNADRCDNILVTCLTCIANKGITCLQLCNTMILQVVFT